ncbi:MAG: hypothetical protein JWP81_3063 [Ferruginibacter sp.]|nr:hypothetical protein [Ferruginibacter sp.]
MVLNIKFVLINSSKYKRMSAKQLPEEVKESPKEIMVHEISAQIALALPGLKERLGEKKFDKRIKKAVKLLTEGIKPEIARIIPVKKSAGGKVKKTQEASPKKKVTDNSTSK